MPDFALQDFDEVEFSAVGWQKVQGQAPLLEQVHDGLGCICRVHRNVVQHNRQGLSYLSHPG